MLNLACTEESSEESAPERARINRRCAPFLGGVLGSRVYRVTGFQCCRVKIELQVTYLDPNKPHF